MNTVRVVKNENYTTISNIFLRDKNLSIKSKGFLAVIMALKKDWDFSINGICSTLKEGKTAVYGIISELKEYGYCKVDICRNEKGIIVGNDYTFYEEPYIDEPYMGNPNVDNQPQLNTNSNKVLNEVSTELIKEDTIVSKKELNFKEIVDYWNSNTKSFSKVQVVSSKIKAAIKARQKDGYSVEDIKKSILLCESLPDFYKGKENGKTWKADFTWLINNTKGNFDKILSGSLHNSSSEKREYDMIMNLGNNSYEEIYSPQCDGMTLSWNNYSNAYICYYEPGTMQFVDGYKDSERPEKATVFRQGIKYSWNKESNKWMKNYGN